METKPKRNNGSQEKLERKIAGINQAIAQFKNKELYSRAQAYSKLNSLLGKIDPASQSKNGRSLSRIISKFKIKF